MTTVQEIFSQLKQNQKDQKDIREEYRDTLLQANEYEEIKEKIEELKKRKKEIETMVQSQMGKRWDDLEDLKNKTKELKETQSDVAITTLMNGQTVEVKDEFDNLYEPRFSVSFKKTSAKAISNEENSDANQPKKLL